MKKKALIIISIIVVAFIIVLLLNNNNNIEKTTAETNLAEPTPEAIPTPEPTIKPTPTPKPTPIPTPTLTPTTETESDVQKDSEANLADEVEIEAETQDEIEYDNYLQEVENEHKKDTSDIVESDIETLNKTMYAQGNVNTRSGPSQDFEKIGGLAVNQEVKVTGQSKETGWYEIEVNGSKQYVSNKFLADSKITVTTSANSSGSAENTQNTGNSGSNGVSASDQAILDSLGATQSTGGWGNTINWGSGDYSSGEGIHAE